MATSYQDPFGAADYSAEGTRGLLEFLRNEYPRIYGAGAGLLGTTPYDTADAYSVFDPKRQAAFNAAQVAFPVGLAAEVIPGVRSLKQPAMQLGRAGERLAERVVPQIMERGGMGAGLLDAFATQPKFMVTPEEVSKFKSSTQSLTGNNVFDPRFDDRILEQERLKNLRTTVIPVNDYVAPKVSLGQYEGYPFITSMSDRTGTGLLTDINDVVLNYPVERQGGQNYMFENPFVWASGKDPAADILELAQEFRKTTGKNPLYIPQRMTPSGGDFANMTGETMLSYAQAAMGQSGKKQLDKFVKNNYIADWKGLDDPSSIDQFRSLSDKKRKSMKKQMDKYFRNEGGLSIGEARLAMADKNQLTSKDAGIMNIGEIYANQPIIPVSGHRAYPSAVPGRGLGVADKDLNIFQLLEQHSKNRGLLDPTNPTRDDKRTLEMKPYGGVLTGDLLKKLGY